MMRSCKSKVLGLTVPGNGRSCRQHTCCGMFVVPNDIIPFRLAVLHGMGEEMEIENKDIKPKKPQKLFMSRMAPSCTQWDSYQHKLLQQRRIRKYILGDLHKY